MLKQTTTNNDCTMPTMGTINMKNNNTSNTDLSEQQNYLFVNQQSNNQNYRNQLTGEVLLADKADNKLNKSNKMSSFDENFFLLQQFSMTPQLPQSQMQSCHTPSFVDNGGILSTSEEESFTCPQCYRTYRRHGTLRRHLRQECGKGKSMVCSVCGHRTKRADHLRQHVRKKHPEVAMRSLFRRVSLATPGGANDVGTSSSDGKVVTSNFLQQQLQQSVNAVTAAVALNLSAAAGTSSGNNLNEIVNLDDDDDDGDNNYEREEEHENDDTYNDHKDNKDYYDEHGQQRPESSLDHLKISCYNTTDVDKTVGSFKC